MASGQFIDHDLVHVPVFSKEDGEGFDCCSALLGNNTLECFPISIPPNDLEFHPRTCLNFVRSLPAPDIDCRAGPNEQMNQITHWLDSSNIYGSTEEELIALRTFRKGLLTLDPENENLPPNINNDECLDPNNCFLAGDSRVNEQTALTSVHTLWARQHNKVATVLNSQNSTWTDEELFQVTRQIVNAQWQHVVYNEWLPIVLGPTTMQEFGLWTLRKAAFRVGHTLIPSALRSYNILNAKPTGSLLLRNNFNNPKQLQTPGFLDEITFGMVIQNIEDFDNRISDEIQNHLFELNDEGLDLIAVNLQRGRDHGIPGYIFYLEICGSRKIKRFEDLKYNMALENINLLKRIYNNVKDIDLFIGMLLEINLPDLKEGIVSSMIWMENQPALSHLSN
ncbi:PXDN [Lepeophtheirus salmonis]|uniref:PXDN n=1 Tax=Lepeophtheirus salmonis TaxID=72036 RepID=A0A7R8H7T1_LEPSM|nr:PXDN [Lepeophtheirus salmonis]CAF2924688.1 PXDN [Lepeophtheirus salmonis]